MTAALLGVDRAAAFLPESGPLRRLPRAPEKQRPAAFHERFEDRALVYDCFWHADGNRILLVGPPPMNLAPLYRTARYEALPSRTPLGAKHHASLSTMITELHGAPPETTAIRMQLDDASFELPIGVHYSPAMAGRRVLFTMNKDNDLAWIAQWACWHARLHGTDAVVLFDNGSTRYEPEDLEETLVSIPGVEVVAVPRWPGRFGMTDHALNINPYWSHFLQISSMSVALRRFAAAAAGLLNCDIDELAATRSGSPIYDHLTIARRGLVVLQGEWMEAVGQGPDHAAFTQRLRDPKARHSPRKWLLDPRRKWVQSLAVHPYWHWVRRRPMFGKTAPSDAFYRHFKAINTRWKETRPVPTDVESIETDTAFVADLARSNPAATTA